MLSLRSVRARAVRCGTDLLVAWLGVEFRRKGDLSIQEGAIR